jgi:hypothetical protein
VISSESSVVGVQEWPCMRDETILAELHQLATLKSVLTWALAREPRAEFVDVVIQDEFHHDVIVRVSDRVYAVFETS